MIDLLVQLPPLLLHFLVILNPLALCLYLTDVMDELESRQFTLVIVRACVISLVSFWIFAVFGDALLDEWLGISPSALKVFGGAIFFVIGYNYVVKGWKAANALRGNLEELPSAIALPFMIGAGTITQAILIGKTFASGGPRMLGSLIVLAVAMVVSFAAVMLFKLIRDQMHGRREKIFERYVNILVRFNGLIIGAFASQMTITGLYELWLGGPPPSAI